MAHSKAKLKSNGDKASPCLRPFWIVKLSDKCLPIWTLLVVNNKTNNNCRSDKRNWEPKCLGCTWSKQTLAYDRQLTLQKRTHETL
jgi:hypothetical protein